MVGHVDSAAHRYDDIVSSTLEGLAAPSQQVTYSITMSMEMMSCDKHDDSFFEAPVFSVLWTIREGSHYDIARMSLPMIPEPIEISYVQEKICECWDELVFSRQVREMAELDHALDAISDGEEPPQES